MSNVADICRMFSFMWYMRSMSGIRQYNNNMAYSSTIVVSRRKISYKTCETYSPFVDVEVETDKTND